jgi:hypothetical protein
MSDTTSELRRQLTFLTCKIEMGDDTVHGITVKLPDHQVDAILEILAAQKQRWEAEARKDEVRNAKVVHMDMPVEGIKKTFDNWCFIRQEEINDGKPARYEYEARAIDEYNQRFEV